jgi:hypothetical protein
MIDGCITQDDGTELCADLACEPLYEGSDCSCDPMTGECTCNVWTYLACRQSTP